MMNECEVALRSLCPHGFIFAIEHNQHTECPMNGCSMKRWTRCQKTWHHTQTQGENTVSVQLKHFGDLTEHQLQGIERRLTLRLQQQPN